MHEKMIEEVTANKDTIINEYIGQNNLGEAAKRLLELQKESWQTLSSGYNSLKFIKTKVIPFDAFNFAIQYNPGRYISTSAMVDEKSITNRKCFLCEKNLPDQQKGILINDYILLANPYPIFPEHFTITHKIHKDQSIKNSFGDLLFFSKIFSKFYTIFYNGPGCGASAPDHLHFQAGSKFSMPLDNEYDTIKNIYGALLSNTNDHSLYFVDDGMRKIFAIEGNEEKNIMNIFNLFLEVYSSGSNIYEPMMNILCSYNEAKVWRVLIMLRAKHRPEEFYNKGEERILFSPAACDYGGLCITPLEKDFERFNSRLLNKIFKETSISQAIFQKLKEDLQSKI